MTRIAFLHTGAVVIPTFNALSAAHLTGIDVQHLLDDKIVGDLGAGVDPTHIEARLSALGEAAREAGAEAVVFSCSSISGFADRVAQNVGIPVFRIDEAMADEAVQSAEQISVIATLPTTLVPTVALLNERALHAGRQVVLNEALVEGAFAAVVAGDRDTHDALVAAAIERESSRSELIVLAQASMASAAEKARVSVPVLTSPERGVRRIAERFSPGAA